MHTIVLAYFGNRDESLAIGWLARRHTASVVTVTLDVGQSSTLEDVRERAMALGAVRAHVIDAREELARDFAWPALAAGAIREVPVLGRALTSPVVARRLVEIADLEGAVSIAHALDEPADALRLERALAALSPDRHVIAVGQEWSLGERDKLDYASEIGMPPSWVAENSGVAGNLFEPFRQGRLRAVLHASIESPSVSITFEHGVPTGVNGVVLDPIDLVVTLQTIGGPYAASSAAPALGTAYAALQREVLPRDLDVLATTLGSAYAHLIERGDWYSPMREALDAFFGQVRTRVSGEVTIKFAEDRWGVTAVAAAAAWGPSRDAVVAIAAVGKDS